MATVISAEKKQLRIQNKKKSQVAEIWRRYQKNKLALVGLIVFLIMVIGALATTFLFDYQDDVIEQNISIRFQRPSAEHPFGTDHFGRDIFARTLWGARISMFIGMISVLMSLVFGTTIGAAAAFYGGKLDEYLMRAMDIVLAIPETLLAISIVAAFGNSMPNILLAISVGQVPKMARIIRSTVLTIKDMDYIEAARSCATRDIRIILRHILPNAIGPILVNAMLTVSRAILQVSALSFIGLGIAPPSPEWGNMLSEAKNHIRDHTYLIAAPGLAIMMTVMSLTLIGDGIQDALDPKLRN